MQTAELKASIQEGLANIDKESGEDTVILSSEYCPSTPGDGIVPGGCSGNRFILKTDDDMEIERGFIPTAYVPCEIDVVSLFEKLLDGIREVKTSDAFADSGLDRYM